MMAGVFTMAGGDSEQLIIFSIFALVCLRLLRQLWHSFWNAVLPLVNLLNGTGEKIGEKILNYMLL